MPRQPRLDAPGTDVKVVGPDWGSGLGGEGNKKRRGACRVGFASREAAEEDIERKAFVLSVGGGEDGDIRVRRGHGFRV